MRPFPSASLRRWSAFVLDPASPYTYRVRHVLSLGRHRSIILVTRTPKQEETT